MKMVITSTCIIEGPTRESIINTATDALANMKETADEYGKGEAAITMMEGFDFPDITLPNN